MKKSIEKMRIEYSGAPLLEEQLLSDPIDQFLYWFKQATKMQVFEPNGMTLSTVSGTGRVSARTLLLKGVEKGSFCFYTNADSRKGEQLFAHKGASLTFWWREIYRQVCIEGRVEKLSRNKSLAYFYKRPKGAQLAALASKQSSPLSSREELDIIYKELSKKYRGKEVPCPKQWTGYRLLPDRMEFWQGQKNRLHDRFVYVKTNDSWTSFRLFP